MLISAKIVYNTILLMALTLLAFGAYSVVAGNPVKDTGLFLLVFFASFSIAFTFLSSIAAKASNSATLTAILRFSGNTSCAAHPAAAAVRYPCG
jgi:heme exporter protein B